MTLALSLAICAMAIVALNLWSSRREADGDWHPTHDSKMRRSTEPGLWELRPMTDDELSEQSDAMVW